MSIQRVHNVYLADTARVLGEVQLGQDVTVWYGAVVRGDVAAITIGDSTNVQDNAVIHCDSGEPNAIGRCVTIGHSAIVHGKAIGDGSLIGMGARVLGGTVIGKQCLIAAGAVLKPNMVVPDHSVVMGVPGRIVRETTDQEKEYMAWLWPHYVELAQRHAGQPDHPTIRPWNGNAARSDIV